MQKKIKPGEFLNCKDSFEMIGVKEVSMDMAGMKAGEGGRGEI